jgi:hypothetical protein
MAPLPPPTVIPPSVTSLDQCAANRSATTLAPVSPKSKSASRKRQQSNADKSVNKRNKSTADDNDNLNEAAIAIEAFQGPKGGKKAKKTGKNRYLIHFF